VPTKKFREINQGAAVYFNGIKKKVREDLADKDGRLTAGVPDQFYAVQKETKFGLLASNAVFAVWNGGDPFAWPVYVKITGAAAGIARQIYGPIPQRTREDKIRIFSPQDKVLLFIEGTEPPV